MNDPIVQVLAVFFILLVIFGSIALFILYTLKAFGLAQSGPRNYVAPLIATGAALYTVNRFNRLETELKEIKSAQKKSS